MTGATGTVMIKTDRAIQEDCQNRVWARNAEKMGPVEKEKGPVVQEATEPVDDPSCIEEEVPAGDGEVAPVVVVEDSVAPSKEPAVPLPSETRSLQVTGNIEIHRSTGEGVCR